MKIKVGNKHFNELDDKMEILEALNYLKSREVEINWVKCQDSLGMVTVGYALAQGPPEMPTSIDLYLNRGIPSMSQRVKNVLDSITYYDNYVDSMKSNKETLEIKRLFEGK